jgi:hypothetical protein
MDITLQELKTMKAKQLRRLIREAITEVLTEDEAKTKNLRIQAAKLDQQAATLRKQAADEETKDAQQDAQAATNENLEELARLAKGYRLANPEINSTTFTKTISGVPLSSIIDYFRQNPGAEKAQMQSHFGFVRPQIANAIVNGLLDAGVLVKLGAGGEVEATPEPGEEQPEDVTGPEALFIGGGNPLAQYFDDEPNDDGSEDFNAEEEPTIAAAGTAPTSTASMSDEDYEAFMEYTKLADRLAATKSNILKIKRSRGGTAGDIKDTTGGNELSRLQDLKKSLQDKIDALVAGSNYLKKRTGQSTIEEPIESPEEDETIDEAFDREYELRKLQFYAGIIK